MEEIINGIEVTRIIGSLLKAGGTLTGSRRKDEPFINWVKSLVVNGRNFTEGEVERIHEYVFLYITDGKLELELNAKSFLRGLK